MDYGDLSTYPMDTYSSSGSDAAAGMLAGLGALGLVGGIVAFIVGLAVMVFSFYVGAKIIYKMGYNPWLVLLQLIPLAGLIMVLYFAFAEWPVHKELNALKSGKSDVKS